MSALNLLPDTAELSRMTIGKLLDLYPFVSSFFAQEQTQTFVDEPELTLADCLRDKRETEGLEQGYDPTYLERLGGFIEEMLDFLDEPEAKVSTLTLRGGRDKDGAPEPVSELTLHAGEVVCIVGPTGSGKSRLLADIEWVAQGDTPTGRQVLLDGEVPQADWRFAADRKLVAQLSQNMNFVMDLSVEEFIALHAESRGADEVDDLVSRIWEQANELAGEPFARDTPVTSLSGGQSRALMIADTAILSSSPIVLIDEIENAGIDRQRALELLLAEEKIVLLATHDPILALSGARRIVIANGAMQNVLQPTAAEKESAARLAKIDAQLMALRQRLRAGELLEDVHLELDE
ncbi:MAG: ABC transporter [Proteobacteria bacterium]|nr:MAG: ABC transporter [Pseudomonadota bacterium]PIE18085.1 MAG: ABC transporter [Pseudomonadota bacterium]